jgi:hypothetical protein
MTTSTASNSYSLTASDIGAFPTLISLQNLIGPSMPAFTDSSVGAFFGRPDALSKAYTVFNNALVKSWIEQFFANLETVDTSYASKFPSLYLAYEYGCFWVGTSNNLQSTYEDCFQSVGQAWTRFLTSGPGWSDDCIPGIFESWPRPAAPASWSQAINQTLAAWGNKPPVNLISLAGSDVAESKRNARALIHLSKWTDAGAVRTHTTALWTAQSSELAALLAQQSLDASDFLFVLHLAIAMGSGPAPDQAKLAAIMTAETNSVENPNDNFADQLVYLLLMHLGDPRGGFGWTNTQLRTWALNLIGVVQSPDRGSSAILTALQQQLKVLTSDASYPLQDPYNPGIGFTTRLTDTLFALNQTWKSIGSAAQVKTAAVRPHLVRAPHLDRDVAQQQLSPAELPAVRTILATQNMLGQGAPVFTAQSALAMMAQLDTLSGVYPQLANSLFQGWVTQLYSLLAGVNTSYNLPFPALCLAYEVSRFPFNPYAEFVPLGWCAPAGLFLNRVTQSMTVAPNVPLTVWPSAILVSGTAYEVSQWGVYPAFASACVLRYHQIATGTGTYDEPGSNSRAPWPGPPANPVAWNQTVTNLLQSWGLTNAPAALFQTTTFDNYSSSLSGLLSPASWSNIEQVKSGVAAVWQSQSSEINTLISAQTLSSATYFFFLHLLTGIVSGNPACQTLAQQVVSAICSSIEYPNDTFINQLIYASLMYLADPMGSYAWNNPQLQTWVSAMTAVVPGADPASTAILASLTNHAKLLNADASYPLQDPYNPGVGFNQRVTDTLYALDQSRASMNQGTTMRHGAGA